jgi:hypothetical protein
MGQAFAALVLRLRFDGFDDHAQRIRFFGKAVAIIFSFA